MARTKWAVAFVLASSVPAFAANPAEFLVYNFDRYGNGLEQNSNDLAGRLYVPTDYDPSQSYPLVTFFHGLGERGSAEYGSFGTQNTQQVNGNINNLLSAAKSRDFFLYAPQCWGGWGMDNLNNAVNQVAKISSEYNIDSQRRYVTGLSLGGGGTMDTLGAYSHVFAGAVNICGSDNGIALRPTQVATVPLWIHHAQNDGTVNVSVSRNRVNAIRNAKGLSTLSFPVAGNYVDDGTLRYTEYTSGGHAIWGSVYGQSQVYDWMLAQNKGTPAMELGDRLLFDLGATELTTTVNGETWNSTSYGLRATAGPVRSFVKTSEGIGTPAVLTVTDTFASETTTPTPASYFSDAWTVTTSNAGALTLEGLTPGLLYDIELFGSSTSTNSLTRFTVGGSFEDLLTYNNSSATILFEDIAADLTGAISVGVSVAAGGGSGTLNWMSVTAVPEPTAAGIFVAAALGATLRRRRR